MLIQYSIKSNYGKQFMYPENQTARGICKLTKKRTLSSADLRIAQEMGIMNEQVMAKPNF